jgi:glycosidase
LRIFGGFLLNFPSIRPTKDVEIVLKFCSNRSGLLMAWFTLSLLTAPAALYAEQRVAPPISSVQHPAWSRDLAIYEVNLRQYSTGGTFKEFAAHLPRLQSLGVGILWFMPLQPIGEVNRKGPLGSYYSVKDYRAVNPDHGTLADFRNLVTQIHDMGMYVLIDWVGNHTAWDNPLAKAHPDWYTHDSTGSFVPPVPDWHDVIDLNYDNPDLRAYMIESLKFWVDSTGIDGFRCDVSGMVPMSFWNQARQELNKIKPVFILAEDENPLCHDQAFDMTYGWELHKLMNLLARKQAPVSALDAYFAKNVANYPADAYRMYFTDNHDENSWNGTVVERLGKAAQVFAVLSATAPGMPLIYSGQEAGLSKRLKFFEKDTIVWHDTPWVDLYQTLLALKRRNHALWNGSAGGDLVRIPTDNDSSVFAFSRTRDNQSVLVILNLSPLPQQVLLRGAPLAGDFRNVFTGKDERPPFLSAAALKPWSYRVYEQ